MIFLIILLVDALDVLTHLLHKHLKNYLKELCLLSITENRSNKKQEAFRV